MDENKFTTRGEDLFKFSKLIIAINIHNVHWICAAVFMEEKGIQVYDSLGGDGDVPLHNIYLYLKDEHMDKKKTELPGIGDW